MGMNMVSKGVQNVLEYLQVEFPDMEVVGISGELLQLLFRDSLLQLIVLIVWWPLISLGISYKAY